MVVTRENIFPLVAADGVSGCTGAQDCTISPGREGGEGEDIT